MAFRDFTFPEVEDMLEISVTEADLSSNLLAIKPRDEFIEYLRDGVELALAIYTEKARSEFIIAPVLFELRRSLQGSFGLFSGIEFNVDPLRNLNGYCDFILTKSPRQMILTAPLVTIVEAKNDNLRSGIGQCIAEMVAAQVFNQKANTVVEAIYGVVTTGSAWQFMQLRQDQVTIDIHEYYIDNLGKIMGILMHMIQGKA